MCIFIHFYIGYIQKKHLALPSTQKRKMTSKWPPIKPESCCPENSCWPLKRSRCLLSSETERAHLIHKWEAKHKFRVFLLHATSAVMVFLVSLVRKHLLKINVTAAHCKTAQRSPNPSWDMQVCVCRSQMKYSFLDVGWNRNIPHMK